MARPMPAGGSSLAQDDKHSLSERILREVYALYHDPAAMLKRSEYGKVGLCEMSTAARMTPELITPRRRCTVMIIGNHSAGKSSFINYYVDDDVQPTGVAVETRGFTIVRSGLAEQDVTGEGALLDNEHVAAVAARLGADRAQFVENLALLVRTSTSRDFANVDLIDTPGLCDGEITYPFDCNRAIVELASVADLVLVFLDPQGQALVSRTMSVVKDLNAKGFHDKMRYFLTKADTVTRQDDLHKVIAQITQNLTQRLHNTHGFELPCLWIPQEQRLALEQRTTDSAAAAHFGASFLAASSYAAVAASSSPAAEATKQQGRHHLSFLAPENNGLYKLIAGIRRVIDSKVQANMGQCQRDCRRIIDHIDAEMAVEAQRAAVKGRWAAYTWCLVPLFPLLAAFSFLDLLVALQPHLPPSVVEAPAVAALLALCAPALLASAQLLAALGVASLQKRLLAAAGAFLLLSTLSQFLRCRSRGLHTRSHAEAAQLRASQANAEVMLKHVTDLFQRYVRAVQTPEYPVAAAAAATTPAAAAVSGTPKGNPAR